MQLSSTTTVDDVKAVVVESLGLEDRARAEAMDAATPLFGAVPELDSLGVVELILALEERFGVEIADDDVTAEAFATLGSLTALVAGRAAS